jgi:hypothetical protein
MKLSLLLWVDKFSLISKTAEEKYKLFGRVSSKEANV